MTIRFESKGIWEQKVLESTNGPKLVEMGDLLMMMSDDVGFVVLGTRDDHYGIQVCFYSAFSCHAPLEQFCSDLMCEDAAGKNSWRKEHMLSDLMMGMV